MGRSVALAGASIFGLAGLLMVTRSSDAASSTGVLIEGRMRTIQHGPGITARAAPTLAGEDCELHVNGGSSQWQHKISVDGAFATRASAIHARSRQSPPRRAA